MNHFKLMAIFSLFVFNGGMHAYNYPLTAAQKNYRILASGVGVVAFGIANSGYPGAVRIMPALVGGSVGGFIGCAAFNIVIALSREAMKRKCEENRRQRINSGAQAVQGFPSFLPDGSPNRDRLSFAEIRMRYWAGRL